jgi:hypothetical protein
MSHRWQRFATQGDRANSDLVGTIAFKHEAHEAHQGHEVGDLKEVGGGCLELRFRHFVLFESFVFFVVNSGEDARLCLPPITLIG